MSRTLLLLLVVAVATGMRSVVFGFVCSSNRWRNIVVARSSSMSNSNTIPEQLEDEREVIYCGHRCYWRRKRCPEESGVPTMIILGGVAEDMSTGWHAFERDWTKHAHLIFCDLPGSGRASQNRDGSFDFLCNCLRAIVQDARLQKVSLVGVSYGAAIAYRYSQLFPDSVSSMVLYGMKVAWSPDRGPMDRADRLHEAGLHKSPEFREAIQDMLSVAGDDLLRERLKNARKIDYIINKVTENLHDGRRAQRFKEVILPLEGFLEAFSPHPLPQCPTLFITGELDHIAPVALVEEIVNGMEDGRVKIMEKCDHMGYLADRPTFTRNVIQFLRETKLSIE